jgi:hypothetical protein
LGRLLNLQPDEVAELGQFGLLRFQRGEANAVGVSVNVSGPAENKFYRLRRL